MADSTAAAVSSAPVTESTTSNAQNVAPEVNSGVKNVVTEGQKPPVQQPPSRFKIKIDGKDEDVDIETLKREYSKSKGAEKRFEEAARMRQQAEEFVRMLRQDPRKILQDPRIGVDMRKLAEDYLREQIEQETLDPKERQLREYQRKLKEHEDQLKEFQRQQAEAQQQALTQHYQQEFDQSIAQALRESGLPKTPRTVRRMAEHMERNLEYGLDLQPKDLVEMVRKDYIAEMQELFGPTDGDTLLGLLGDSITNKIRQSDLKRLRASVAPQSAPPAVSKVSKPSEEAPSKYKSIYEWREELEKKFGK